MAVNAAANRALAPEGSKLLELETQVIHIDLGETKNGCDKCITQNSPQTMRVWPGLRLIGAGGKIPKGVFVAVAEVEPDGVRLDNAAAGHPAEPRSYLRQLPGAHPPQPRPPGPGVLPPVRGRRGLERAARRLQAHLEEHAPLPAHQPHVPGLHKRAAPAARELRGARRTVAGGVSEEAALQVHLALHVLALGAHLDGALQLALKLGAGGPRKGLLEDDHVLDALLHLLRPQLQVGVARKAHALAPSCWKLPGLQHLHIRLAHQRALTGVLYGHELFLLGIGLKMARLLELFCGTKSVGRAFEAAG